MGCDLNTAWPGNPLILHGQYPTLQGWEACGWRKFTWLSLGQRPPGRKGVPGAAPTKAHLVVRGSVLGLPASSQCDEELGPMGLLMEQGSCQPLPALIDNSELWAELRQIMCRMVRMVQDVPRQ